MCNACWILSDNHTKSFPQIMPKRFHVTLTSGRTEVNQSVKSIRVSAVTGLLRPPPGDGISAGPGGAEDL